VLDAKGGENKAKAINGSATTWDFLKNRVRVFVCQNTLVCLLLSKVGLLWEEGFIMGKRGSFWNLWSILLEQLLLCLNKCFWLRDRDLRLICKNKPSGGKEWSIYAKFESKQFWVLIRIDVALPLAAFYCVGINHQKGGDWKGNVPLGHFYVFWWLSANTSA
jgi:hypothetical protein